MKVNLNAWIAPNATHNNIGDYLSLVVVQNMCRLKGIDMYRTVDKTKHLYAIGSILPGYQDATIWGSGFGFDKPRKWYSPAYNFFHKYYHHLDIRAVRGPETKRILNNMGLDCPEIYGDPAVLMPLFYEKKEHVPKRKYILIPHYSKWENFEGQDNVCSTFVKDYRSVIDAIVESELVISSSLHGLILAEAYRVPAVMLKDTPSADITKYKDWYYSTGRESFPVANSVQEALELGGTPLDYGVIERMQATLLETFPSDLWGD